MSHPIINVGRYHGGSDDWRTPYRLFHNLHREFNFSLDGAASEHDALLPRFTDDAANQSWIGEKVFCNPPFSMAEKFLLKAPKHHLQDCSKVELRFSYRVLITRMLKRRFPFLGLFAFYWKGYFTEVFQTPSIIRNEQQTKSEK